MVPALAACVRPNHDQFARKKEHFMHCGGKVSSLFSVQVQYKNVFLLYDTTGTATAYDWCFAHLVEGICV